MKFSDEQIRRLEHVADGKPVPENEIDRRLAWDKPLTIDVPQDARGTFKKPMTASIWALVAHVKRHTPSAESRVLAAGIEAVIEEMTKRTTEPVAPSPPHEQEGFSSLRGALGFEERKSKPRYLRPGPFVSFSDDED